MQEFIGIEYLCIDIANNFGKCEETGFKGDHATFDERIAWTKANYDQLEELMEYADEPELYIKSVFALRDSVDGKATGSLISLDSTCSGIQILSALTGCIKGGTITNIVDPNNRHDAYTKITDTTNHFLQEANIPSFRVSRSNAKDAVMTGCYGSRREPRRIFGENVKFFDKACLTEATGAFKLLPLLVNAWNPTSELHTFVMPDGHHVHLPTVLENEVTIEINEIRHKFTTYTKEVGTQERAVSLAAHVTHACDSYLLRNVIRRTNFNMALIKNNLRLVSGHASTESSTGARVATKRLTDTYNLVGSFDAQLANLNLRAADVAYMTPELRTKLQQVLESMVHYGSFHTLPVHDAFRVHPNNGNAIRYHYKEALADMADSSMLDHIYWQLTGKNLPISRNGQMGDIIRNNSNYHIC